MSFTGKPMLRLAQLVIGFNTFFWISVASATTVISEVFYDAAAADNGFAFIELFGVPGTVLDGLCLEGVNGLDGSVYRSLALSGTIPADGVFLIGDDRGDGTSFVSNADLILEVDFQNGPDSIVLRDADTVLDALGYGDFTTAVFAGEGSAAADAPAGSSLARIDPMLDSNNNLSDFLVLEFPTPGSVPGSTSTSPVPLPPAVMMMLSGIIGLAGVARRRQ